MTQEVGISGLHNPLCHAMSGGDVIGETSGKTLLLGKRIAFETQR